MSYFKQERVEECIQRVMVEHPGERPADLAKYFEAVHQELAPLARELEKQRDELLAALESMVGIARLTVGWSCTPLNADGPLSVAERLIASVKGGAA